MDVMLVNDYTGKLKPVKIGWSWEICLWVDIFFIPLLRRKLFGWAIFRFVIDIGFLVIYLFSLNNQHSDISLETLSAVILLLTIGLLAGLVNYFYLCLKGNELFAKKLLKGDWTFAEPQSTTTIYAKKRWRIS